MNLEMVWPYRLPPHIMTECSIIGERCCVGGDGDPDYIWNTIYR